MDERGVEGGSEAEGGQGLVGETHEILCARGAASDGGDGGVVLTFEMPASEVPRDYAISAVDTVWRVEIKEKGRADVAFDGVRMSTKDMRRGMATVRLGALASDMEPDDIFGRKGSQILLSLTMTAAERPTNLDKSERLRVLRACFAHCREPEFLDWLEAEATRRGYPSQVRDADQATRGDHEPTTEDRTAEYVYLLARIHSREEVLENAAAANAVDDLLRRYRGAMWHRRR